VTETVTRLRAPSTTDRYGATVPDWDNATELDVTSCIVAPRTQEEETGNGRVAVPIGFTVYAPAGTDIIETDRLEVRGEPCEVDGKPAVWTDPWTNTTRGVEVPVRTVDG
jgi:hypothetical protein